MQIWWNMMFHYKLNYPTTHTSTAESISFWKSLKYFFMEWYFMVSASQMSNFAAFHKLYELSASSSLLAKEKAVEI